MIRSSGVGIILAAIAVCGCVADSGAPAISLEYSGVDTTLKIEYRTRVQVDKDRGTVRELRQVIPPPAVRQMPGYQPYSPEIEIWGERGTFRAPIRSTCRIFDRSNWSCENANTAFLRNTQGDPLIVGRLEMHQGVLREAEVSGVPVEYHTRTLIFGHAF